MSRLKRPSPALVISILALVAALVVPAYAALNKKDKKTVKNLANAEITKRAPGLAVASANTATSANNADSADAVGGFNATCLGPNKLAVAGLCFDSSSRAAAGWVAAATDCAADDASLPTVGQLWLALEELGNVADGGEWTDSLHFDGTIFRAHEVGPPNGVEETISATENRPYRCVTPLVR